MNFTHAVVGQRYKWSLEAKLGEGDAGEVYLVESFLEGKQAILKRPRKGSYAGDILRQASQIKTEGNILRALNSIAFPDLGTRVTVPSLLDRSLPEDGLGDRFFIVLDRALGLDLKSLSKLVRYGKGAEIRSSSSDDDRIFIEKICEHKKFPEAILIRSLYTVINLLEAIHGTEVLQEGVNQSGVIWNDVKPEHMYWDPNRVCLTIIDWGNGYFLESDGVTKDRQHSAKDDDYQLIQSMGDFLAESCPELFERLEWPREITRSTAHSAGIEPLKEKLAILHAEVLSQAQEIRDDALSLYNNHRPAFSHLSKSKDLHRKIVALGEMPDLTSAINFHARVALKMASESNLEGFRQVCERTANLAVSESPKWALLAEIAQIPLRQGAEKGDELWGAFSRALTSGAAGDFPGMLWELFVSISFVQLPEWWENVSQWARRVYLNLDKETLTPYYTVGRLFYTLQSILQQMEGENRSADLLEKEQSLERLLKNFDEEVLKKWRDIEPAPPNSGLGYHAIRHILDDIEAVLPGSKEKLAAVLTQPVAQSEIVLKAWDRKDFETARKALRMALIWDPDLRRLLQADRAIGAASRWLSDVRNGAGTDEPFYDFLTSIELAGRNLRNRVGRAKWLDLILEALKRLRKGARPADLIMEHPELTLEIPWLNEYRSREVLSLTRSRPLAIDRDRIVTGQVKTVSGVVEGRLGPDRDFILAEPLDTWVPEARGSSARVFAGVFRDKLNHQSSFAIKVIRPDQVDYALPLFREEAQILSLLRDVPGITPLVECGFLKIEDGLEFPAEDKGSSASKLRGQLIRYGSEEVQNFLVSIERQLATGWLPYLALVRRDQDQNLMVYCDAGYNRGWFLPLKESLLLSIQICDILQYAHDRNIVYRDHKILHYYWDPDSHGVVMIDWNIAKRQSQGLSEAERQFDIVQFGARALHHILTGRPAAGSLPLGPNRPDEIEQASLSYPVNWTYDDERLPVRIKEILECVLNQGYTHLRDLRLDLVQVYEQLADSVSVVENSPS